jgi:hypothetical protein
MCNKREIQPLYKKALISSNIFLIECVSVVGMRNRREIQPLYKKALISLNISLIKCSNGHSLIALTFVSRYKSNQEPLQKGVIDSLESLFVVGPLLICEATTDQCW